MSNMTILSSFVTAYKDSYQTAPPKGSTTLHQKALFVVWLIASLFWVYRRFGKFIWKRNETDATSPITVPVSATTNENDVVIKVETEQPAPKPHYDPITLNDALFAVFTVGFILLYYYFCDYLHYFPKADRTYNRDLYMFLVFLLFAVSIYFTTKELKPSAAKLLNREQTEEWKGWMQVMFVWYHYFHAAETYNAIRLFIAAYVWMTGFGNFSFFWIRKDYSLRRILKMLFRLNFLVILTTLVVDNSYMLYYICAMHTFWFLSVYAMMRPFSEYNEVKKVMVMKLVIYFCIVFAIFDIPKVAELVFSPCSFALNYNNSLHEWIFRSKLDHYVTFVGMLCAYNHPNIEKAFHKLNGHRFEKVVLLIGTSVLASIIFVWYNYVYILEKYSYNALHPYTSFIPILAFILLRNSTAWLRSRYIVLFSVLGKITLETYISQLHIYLQDNAKSLLVYVPNYPLVNFVINTSIYLFLSNLLFHGTITLNEYIFPNDMKKVIKNISGIGAVVAVAYLVVGMLTFF